jgi:ribosomal protein L11 methyltransferase
MPDQSRWLKLTLHHPPAAAEGVSALLFEAGAGSVWEDQPDETGRQVTRAGFTPQDRPRLAAELPAIIGQLAWAFGTAAEEFEFALNLEDNHDWSEKWKEWLAPILVDQSLALAPTWWPESGLPEAGVVLRLDPGLAFGSGHHATTFLCLKALAGLAPGATRVLDAGSGSGVLALAVAALNPAAAITGVDNDLSTIAVAEGNAAQNDLTGRVDFSGRPVSGLTGTFDLIAANLTLNPLLELAPELARLSAAGARLIISGLLTDQADEAGAAYTALGFQVERQENLGEWAALILKKW